MPARRTILVALWILAAPLSLAAQPSAARRPMTFLDMQQMKQVGAPAPSPDGRWLLYTLSRPIGRKQAADRHPPGVLQHP
jgi:hypothetical protein